MSSQLLEQRYDLWRGDYNLLKVEPRPADEEARRLCRRFSEMPPSERDATRRALGEEERTLLWWFSKRCAVFALRTRDPAHLVSGLAAYAMLIYERMDYRDLCISHLVYAGRRINANLAPLFQAAAGMAEPQMKKLILDQFASSSTKKDVGMLMMEVETPDGPGFIGKDVHTYAPTLDLARGAISLADLLQSEGYLPESVAVAGFLPDVWFHDDADPRLKRLLRSVRGCATLHARVFPSVRPEGERQGLLVFLAEAGDEAGAEALAGMLPKSDTPDRVSLGVRQGPLFCLLVARSMLFDVRTHESDESMRRFSAPVQEILRSLNSKTGGAAT